MFTARSAEKTLPDDGAYWTICVLKELSQWSFVEKPDFPVNKGTRPAFSFSMCFLLDRFGKLD